MDGGPLPSRLPVTVHMKQDAADLTLAPTGKRCDELARSLRQTFAPAPGGSLEYLHATDELISARLQLEEARAECWPNRPQRLEKNDMQHSILFCRVHLADYLCLFPTKKVTLNPKVGKKFTPALPSHSLTHSLSSQWLQPKHPTSVKCARSPRCGQERFPCSRYPRR